MKEKVEKLYKWMMLLLFAGALLSFYLYYSKITNTSVICPNSGCDEVANSPYSMFWGLPVAAWGLFYYMGMLILLFWARLENWLAFQLLGVGVVWGVIFTLYLRYLELFKLGSFCIWCWGSVVVILFVTILYIMLFNEYNRAPGESKK